jgi:LacI family transcriptional regulator
MDERAGTPADPRPARSSRRTIRHVAEAAGVSVGTVSKALNNSGTLSADTRARIVRIAGELGFRPNDLAQALHRGQSFTVGLISNDSFGRFTLPILEGLERELAAQGIAIFMCNATDDPARERQHIEQLMRKQVDGLIFTARRADRRPEVSVPLRDLPAVFVFSRSDDPHSLCLLPDDEGGARLATAHLLATGRRRIAYVSGPEHFEAVRLRRDGYRAALAEAGLEPADGHVLTGPWSEQAGREAVAVLLGNPATAPDGIFAGNDQIARGVLDALRDRGVAVPGAIGVVGFDNWDVMVEAVRPRLTSVDMNLCALGREAGQQIVRLIGGEVVQGVLRLPCTLVVRESCGAIRIPEGRSN